MKIKMRIRIPNKNNIEFNEIYDIDNNIDPEIYCNNLINNFNSTLRFNENPRELVKVEILEQDSEVKNNHDWKKQNLFTKTRGNHIYDVMKCSRCGITAKRFGLGDIIRDSKYKAKIYDTCEDALKQLEKLANKKLNKGE